MLREGDRPDRSCLLVSGYARRRQGIESGKRQIVSVHIAGDFLDLDGALLNIAEHNLSMLSPSPLNSFRAAGVAPPALQRMFRRSITAVDCTSRTVRALHVRPRYPCRFPVPTALSPSLSAASQFSYCR